MPKKMKKGYFVRGEFVAQGSERDEELKRELKGSESPSRTELKLQSAALQDLGEQLIKLRQDLRDALHLPDALLDALDQAQKLDNFEARRRQMQFIGKLMRKLDPHTLAHARQALDMQAMGPAADTLLLHQAEQWRERMIDNDESLAQWIDQFPGTDIQHLRTLLRQARKDAMPGKPGAASRHGRSYREIFQLIRDTLSQPAPDSAALPEPVYQTQRGAS